MRKKWNSKVALMLIAFLPSGCTKSAAETTQQQRAASVLFDKFETVFHANADLLASADVYKGLSQQGSNALRAPFATLLQALDAVGKPVSAETINNSDAALVGAKDFRAPGGPPPNLGGVQSRFCYILVFGTRSKFDIRKTVHTTGLISSAGAAIWKWSAPPTEGHSYPYTFYAIQIAHSYLVISNNLDDVRAISLTLRSDGVPSVIGLQDWTGISRHEVWGYRRYVRAEENKEAAGTSQITPDTRALAFFADLKQKTGVLRLFSPTARTAYNLNRMDIVTPFRPAGNGVWQTEIPLTGGQQTSEQMFAVMSWFGFGVYI